MCKVIIVPHMYSHESRTHVWSHEWLSYVHFQKLPRQLMWKKKQKYAPYSKWLFVSHFSMQGIVLWKNPILPGITHGRPPTCHSIWLTITIALKNYSIFANQRPFWYTHMHIKLEEASSSLAPITQTISCGPFLSINSLTAFSSNFVSDSTRC